MTFLNIELQHVSHFRQLINLDAIPYLRLAGSLDHSPNSGSNTGTTNSETIADWDTNPLRTRYEPARNRYEPAMFHTRNQRRIYVENIQSKSDMNNK